MLQNSKTTFQSCVFWYMIMGNISTDIILVQHTHTRSTSPHLKQDQWQLVRHDDLMKTHNITWQCAQTFHRCSFLSQAASHFSTVINTQSCFVLGFRYTSSIAPGLMLCVWTLQNWIIIQPVTVVRGGATPCATPHELCSQSGFTRDVFGCV